MVGRHNAKQDVWAIPHTLVCVLASVHFEYTSEN